jgi:ectoine hydroxylase-related dioxygenase (phytanoyl-CoA dioxygenase family)
VPLQVIPGSHRYGLINPSNPSGFLTDEQPTRYCPDDQIVHLELAAGEMVVLYNWLPHSSEVNRTEIPRRAFSVCYMDASAINVNGAERYPEIFGPAAAA